MSRQPCKSDVNVSSNMLPALILFTSLFFSSLGQNIAGINGGKEQNRQDNGLAVVLFFAGIKSETRDVRNENMCPFLNFEKVAEIEPCTPSKEREISKGFGKVLRFSQDKCNCEMLLKTSMMSLVNYARNAMGLTTAIASLKDSDDSSDDLIQTDVKKSINADVNVQLDNKVNEDLPRLEEITSETDSFPIYNAFPNYNKLRFNDINRWSDRATRIKREKWLTPEKTEVFSIDSKDNPRQAEAKEIMDFPRAEQPKNVWDLLGLMSMMKKSFFDSVFTTDQEKRMIDEENALNLNLLGKIKEPSLLELSQRTYRQIRAQNNKNGYLSIVLGGDLQVSDPRSDLVQAVKYFEENSGDNSIMVVTGSCPCKRDVRSTDSKIPVYVKGTSCKEMFTNAKELFDIPELVKGILKKRRKKSDRYQSQFERDFSKYLSADEDIPHSVSEMKLVKRDVITELKLASMSTRAMLTGNVMLIALCILLKS